MKGVLLAGGEGTRLRALTGGRNKHLLPVGDRPMIAHPLGKLVEAGLREALIVSSPSGVAEIADVLGEGEAWGCRLAYRVQERPGGIAEALGLAEGFAAGGPVAVLLGDNLFEDPLGPAVAAFAAEGARGAVVFLKRVPDPERFGVARLEGDRVMELVEKPVSPPSDLAVTGIYLYDGRFGERARALQASARGELEITDLNRAYLEAGELSWRALEGAWLDAGTPESYAEAQRRFGRGP